MLYKANFTKKNTPTQLFLEFGKFSHNKHQEQLKLNSSEHIKREIKDGKKYPLDKNLTYFLVEFTLIFLRLTITTKMYIFPTYSPKRNLESHILHGI